MELFSDCGSKVRFHVPIFKKMWKNKLIFVPQTLLLQKTMMERLLFN